MIQIVKEDFEEGKCESLSNIQAGALTQRSGGWKWSDWGIESDLPEAEQSEALWHLEILAQARPFVKPSRITSYWHAKLLWNHHE